MTWNYTASTAILSAVHFAGRYVLCLILGYDPWGGSGPNVGVAIAMAIMLIPVGVLFDVIAAIRWRRVRDPQAPGRQRRFPPQ